MNVTSISEREGGLHRGLSKTQIVMIGLGGAIGTGLFMGAGARLASAGPGLFLVYGICGGFVFLILRALGDTLTAAPPLIIEPPEIERILHIIGRALDETYDHARAEGWL